MEQYLRDDASEDMMAPKFLPLALPPGASRRERQGFKRLCALLSADRPSDDVPVPNEHADWITAAGIGNLYDQPYLAAAAHTAIDLFDQGWTISVDKFGALFAPPAAGVDRLTEKARVRRQEHLRRDEQLRKPSVRRFIERMERPQLRSGELVSVFNLMRDGADLAGKLCNAETIAGVIEPYVQIVDDSACEHTGLRLHDIWRYFRHTWSNAYSTVPGRSMAILIRDAACAYHPVIGISALSSPVVQIAERDHWIGWDTDQFIAALVERPTAATAKWFAKRIKSHLDEIYIADLLRDGVIEPSDLRSPGVEVVARLRADAERHRRRHYRNSVIRQVKGIDTDAWITRAETDLFRSKRSAALADILDQIQVLMPYLGSKQSANDLRAALDDSRARAQLRKVVRRTRGERVGTVIADLTVCGAIAPYNALAAGKLVAALSVSPEVLRAYRARYSRPSEIASAMAGRPIKRESRLAFIGTTSLYGTGSSQYNRLFWPQQVMGGPGEDRMGFYALGRSRSFGTSHFTEETVEALVRLSSVTGSTVRVNSLFGEGVSPRLRKVRLGLSALGWPTDELLKHGRERIVYGVPLVRNLRDYALGLTNQPKYLLDSDLKNSNDRISNWWFDRWCVRRVRQEHVTTALESHRTIRPIRHGARVPLPDNDKSGQLSLLDFEAAEG